MCVSVLILPQTSCIIFHSLVFVFYCKTGMKPFPTKHSSVYIPFQWGTLACVCPASTLRGPCVNEEPKTCCNKDKHCRSAEGAIWYRPASENAVLTKTIFWSSVKIFMTFPHGIFPIWGTTFSKKVLIRHLTCTYFQEEIFKTYVLGEILNECFSSESRNKNTKMSQYQ